MRKKIKLTESDLHRIIKHSVNRILKEANNEGWTIDSNEVQEAYDFGVKEIGEDELNAAIVRCIGEDQLAEALAYVFRQYDLVKWKERNLMNDEDFEEDDF